MRRVLIILNILAIVLFVGALPLRANVEAQGEKPGKSKGQPKGKNNVTTEGQAGAPDNGQNQKKCNCKKKGEDNNDDSTTTEEKTPTENGCLRFEIPFGRTINEPRIPDGNFLIYRMRPSLSVYSPQGLIYSNNLNTYIIKDETTASGRDITIFTKEGTGIYFNIPTGQSEGTPVGESLNTVTRLVMTDATGSPVTENPVYYMLLSGKDSFLKYSAETKKAVSIKTENGRELDLTSPGIRLDVIRDDYDYLRQIYSGADGLADIVMVDMEAYEIRMYSPEDVGPKVDGLYTLNSGAEPKTVWKVSKPDGYTGLDKVVFTKTVNGVDYVSLFEYDQAVDDWSLTKGGGLRKSAKAIAWNEDKTDSIITETTTELDGTVTYKKITKTHVFNFGEAVTEEIEDPDGAALKTEYTYYEDPADIGKYSRRKTEKEPDGSWKSYDYDTQGRTILEIDSYNDAAFDSDASSAKATYFSYTPVDPADVACENDRRKRTVEVKINGITVSKTYYAYKTEGSEAVFIEEHCTSPSAEYGDASNLKKRMVSYASGSGAALDGRIKYIEFPDGRKDSYSYEYGAYSSSPTPANCSFTAGTGNAMRRIIVHGTTASPDGLAYKSTKDVRITDEFGNNVLNETYIYTGSGYERISWTVNVFDSEHHTTNTYYSNGTETEATWNCCNKESESDASGIEYTYTYDLLQRLATSTKKGYNGTADIVTTYAYDASGRTLSETVTGGSLTLSNSTVYDVAGRITSQTDQSGVTATYLYQNGGRTTTVTQPGGHTEITEKYLDGRVKSVTGTAVIPRYYDYGVNSDGSQWSKVSIGSAMSARWAKTTVDILGRTIKEESPGYTGTVLTQNYYNSKGQLAKVEKTGMADTLYEYDELGNQFRSGLDVNGNGSLDLASMDRINETETLASLESTVWWSVTTNKVYATDNSSTATTVSANKTRLTGLAGSGIVAESKSIDINSNVTTSTTAINRTTKTATQTTDTPDSSVNSVSTSVNGLLTSSQSSQNLAYSYAYDDLGRRTTVTDPRTGQSTTAYYTAGTGKIGKVHTVTDAASNVTSYDYDSSTGRLASVENALNKKSYYAYNDRGQLTKQWGDTGYPIEKVYDSYGQLSQLKTYRAGSGWTASTWPTTTGDAETTSWTYQTSTGLLTAKTDADSKSVVYTYTQDGKLYTRTWARLDGGSALTTTYSYDANTGEMTGIDYSDSTQDITFTYDRLGRQHTVADAVGTRTFAYNSSLQLDTETITGLYSKVLTRDYETTGMIGRNKGFHIGTECDVDYGFDQYGRFNSVSSGSDTFTYGYLTNSNLVSTLTVGDISVNNTYETNRNLITSVENKYSSTTVSKYDYVNDAIGRRTSMAKSGTAFTTSDTISYGYNDRSEVTSATATNDTTYNFGFAFDNIGNRSTYTTNETGSAVTSAYTSNNLNQYTAITNPTNDPTYDNDGNMLTNGDWTYTWNAENRLIKAEKSDQKLEFTYDYMGRRVEKKVTDKVGTIWTVTKHEYFVYDGYKLIEKLNVLDSNAVTQKFVWSGETILSMTDVNGTYYYLIDANKNVGQLLDSSGNIKAKYEYSPFGKLTSSSDNVDNPFRFSSEYADSESGLVYYNYRYYSPELGRWTKQDPIEEDGGVNLYFMVYNNPIYLIDSLGHDPAAAGNNGQITQSRLGGVIPVGNRSELVNNGNGLVRAIPKTPAGDYDINDEDWDDPADIVREETSDFVEDLYKNGIPDKTGEGWRFDFKREAGSSYETFNKDYSTDGERGRCFNPGQLTASYILVKREGNDWIKPSDTTMRRGTNALPPYRQIGHTHEQMLTSIRKQIAHQTKDTYGVYRVHTRKCKCDCNSGTYKWLPYGKSYLVKRKIKTEERELHWKETSSEFWDVYKLETVRGF